MHRQLALTLVLCFCLSAAIPVCAAEAGSNITVLDSVAQSDENTDAAAAYYPSEVETVTELGKTLIRKTFEVPSGTCPQALVESALQRDGMRYAIRDITKKELEPVPEMRLVSKTVSLEVQTDDEQKIQEKLSSTLEYNEGGFTGILALDEDSVTTQATESEGYAYTVRDVRRLFGVNRNDPYYLPQTVRKHGATLKLTNVDWSPMGERYDVNSVPDLYNATATYTGKAYGSKPTAFAVNATYTGEVSRMVPGNLQYTLLYEPVEELLSEEQLAADAAKAKRVALFAAGGFLLVVLVGAGYFLLLELRRRKKKASDSDFDDYDFLEADQPERRMRVPEAMRQMDRPEMEEDADE
ncbi:MAG: hypothetical protein HFG20_11575 [Anaerotruncus sp.]|nr:hypothetical protein [Anaerotruncus sp.]